VGAHLSVRVWRHRPDRGRGGHLRRAGDLYFTDHLPLFEQKRAPSPAPILRTRCCAPHFPPAPMFTGGDGLLPEADAQRFATFMADGLIVRTCRAAH
jgi:hypothetical protein